MRLIPACLFVRSEIFDYLERAKSGSRGSDCSLADGVRLMAGDDKVRAIDIGDAWWQDVDTPQMLQICRETDVGTHAERGHLNGAHHILHRQHAITIVAPV